MRGEQRDDVRVIAPDELHRAAILRNGESEAAVLLRNLDTERPETAQPLDDMIRILTGFVDRDAASVVYQVVDNRTSLVVKQFPDEAMLRRRAYFRALDLVNTERTQDAVTDRRA